MKYLFLSLAAISLLTFAAGCEKISAPYVMKMDRVDQTVSDGNRGYLEGTPPHADDRANLKRPFIAIDVDMIEKDSSGSSS